MKNFSLLIPLKNNFQFSSKNKILQYASVFLVVLAVLFSQNVYSQARAYTNPGLEFGQANSTYAQNDTNFGWGATFNAGLAKMSPWYTSHPSSGSYPCSGAIVGTCHPVEVWGTGFGGVPAAQGTNFVELNAYVSSMIYQNLYLVNGDNISYYFRHRARVSGVEQAGMVIENQNQVNIATIYATTLPSSTGAWSVNQGVYTFTGTTGLYRVGFRALTVGGDPSFGNFLDDVRISMNPIIDMKFSNLTTNCEGNSHGSIFLRINGRVNDPTTVAFELINPLNGSPIASDADLNLTAVANSNGTPVISHTAGTNIYIVTIPIGNYDGGTTLGYASPTNDEDGIQINVASVNDGAEGKETFKFEIKAQNTNGATNNFVSTSSPVFGDPYVGTTNDGFIEDLDSDGDGVADFCDLDDDNDGILDTTEGQCINTSNPSTDGFDSPSVATVNGNNIQSVNPYNGWGTETGGANAFNVIRVNGAGYSSGPDVAQSGTQYIDINNAGTYVYKDIILTTPTVFSASAWFANRESSNGGYAPWSSNIQIRDQTTSVVVAQGNTVNLTAALGDEYWYESAITSVSLLAGTYRIRMFVHNYGHLDSISYCFSTDTDGDGTPNYLDTDSDDDTCPDAVEGSENVSIEQVWPLNLPIADANYANRGKIKVIYDGITTNTQPNIVSQSAAALGVPQLVNNAGNNLNAVTNPSDLAGLADNTDVPGPTTADIGQGAGASSNAAVNACICYNDPNTGTVGADTKHGITLLKRAGATPQPDNWPMERKSAFTALESNTKGFVITRMTTAEINALTGQSGMMVYDTNLKCLKLFDGAAWSCFNTPTCP